MDLDTLELTQEAVAMHICHPQTSEVIGAEEGKPATLYLISDDHPDLTKVRHKYQNKKLKNAFKRGGQTQVTSEEIDEEAYKTIAASVKSWENIFLKGEEIAFSEANVIRLFKRLPWLRRQVEDFVQDMGNFIES